VQWIGQLSWVLGPFVCGSLQNWKTKRENTFGHGLTPLNYENSTRQPVRLAPNYPSTDLMPDFGIAE